jgi:PAS domain S-box-containing protein
MPDSLRSDRRARELLELHRNSPLAVVEWDHEFRVVRWSEQAEALFGWPEAEVAGKHPSEWPFVHPDDNEDIGRVMAELLDGSVSRSLSVHRNYTREGAIVYCEWYNSALFDEGGDLVSILSLVHDVTEHTRAVGDLAASETRFRTIIDVAPDMIFINRNDRIVLINEAGLRLLGASTEQEILGRSPLAIFHPDYHPEIRRRIQQLLEEPTEVPLIEEQLVALDGSLIDVEVAAASYETGDGDLAIQVVCRDIRQRKRAEDSLRASRSLIEMAGRLARFGGWALDVESGDLHWSDETADIHEEPSGYAPTLEQGFDYYAPEWRERVKHLIVACARDGVPFDEEMEIITAKGRRVWVRTVGQAITNPDGTVTRIEGAFQDVTKQRKASAEILRLAHRLVSTLECITDAFYTLDTDWRYTYLNAEAERLQRWKPGELIGQAVWDVFPQALGTEVETAFRRVMSERVTANLRGFHFPPLNAWFDIRVYPIDEGIAVYFQEVTETLTLERQVREARRLDAIGQLTGGVAHDFNNLLTVIMGNAELLAGGDCDEGLHLELTTMIRDAAQRGADLTQRLLAFARRQPLDPVPVDVNARLREIEGLLRRTLSETIDLGLSLRPEAGYAFIDAAQFDTALLNLALNARDAMPAGGRLTIETAAVELDADYAAMHPDLTPGDYVLVAVSDTGTGIAPDDIERVFEPFFTTKAEAKGTGLGLSMVHGFVKQSGGHIKIYSELGHGTTMRLYLPPTAEPARRGEPSERPTGPPAQLAGTETILLVEDDELVLRYADRLLRGFGYTVITAASGPEALPVLESDRQVDLLFTDVVMPGGMSGVELAEKARELRPDIRVLITSGYTEEAILHHGRLDPGVDLLTKPYRRDELIRRLQRVFSETPSVD